MLLDVKANASIRSRTSPSSRTGAGDSAQWVVRRSLRCTTKLVVIGSPVVWLHYIRAGSGLLQFRCSSPSGGRLPAKAISTSHWRAISILIVGYVNIGVKLMSRGHQYVGRIGA